MVTWQIVLTVVAGPVLLMVFYLIFTKLRRWLKERTFGERWYQWSWLPNGEKLYAYGVRPPPEVEFPALECWTFEYETYLSENPQSGNAVQQTDQSYKYTQRELPQVWYGLVPGREKLSEDQTDYMLCKKQPMCSGIGLMVYGREILVLRRKEGIERKWIVSRLHSYDLQSIPPCLASDLHCLIDFLSQYPVQSDREKKDSLAKDVPVPGKYYSEWEKHRSRSESSLSGKNEHAAKNTDSPELLKLQLYSESCLQCPYSKKTP